MYHLSPLYLGDSVHLDLNTANSNPYEFAGLFVVVIGFQLLLLLLLLQQRLPQGLTCIGVQNGWPQVGGLRHQPDL